MKRIFFLPLFAALALGLSSCGKQETDAERKAEIDRQVQERLAAEHQADAQQKLAQQQADLDAREAALAAKENQPAASATPAPATTPALTTSTSAKDSSDDSSYATFYRRLDPYGDWMETTDYGYVFQPRVATQSRDWRPYTEGHWVYTDAGWTWISDEKFGWATYHYGRWTRLRGIGWVWVPGERWAPAWVSWRKGNDFVGWAPLPPDARSDRQTGIGNWADTYYDIGPEQYAFVPANEFGGSESARVVVPTERNVTIINQTINVTNITYNNSIVVDRGPSYEDLRAGSRYKIDRLRLERTQNFQEERPVIRGEVVAMPAPDFLPPQPGTRPARVQRTITQPTVEHGWEGIRDREAAEKARAKMQSEAAPPPHRPSRKVVRPAPTAAAASATPVPTKAAITPARPTAAPTRAPVQPAATTPPRPRPKPATPSSNPTQPAATPATPVPITSPTPSAEPSLNPKQEKLRERRKAIRAEKRKERQAEKATGASATPSASPAASETPSPGKKNRHPGPSPNRP